MPASLCNNASRLVLKAWDVRKRNADRLKPLLHGKRAQVSGMRAVVFQPPPLPGSSGLYRCRPTLITRAS